MGSTGVNMDVGLAIGNTVGIFVTVGTTRTLFSTLQLAIIIQDHKRAKDRFSIQITSVIVPLLSCALVSMRPTACVTRWWARRDNAILPEPTSSHANCPKTRRVPP